MNKSLLFLLIPLCSVAQINPVEVGLLPSLINESSGLEISASGHVWTHNDDNDGERIFALTENGAFVGQVFLNNTTQVDYEDITSDEAGNFYIGDFGNNDSDRTDLKILKISDPEAVLPGSMDVEEITFTLSDQTDFPPSDDAQNFDIEAMYHFNGTLHLFSRNRTSPYNGITKWYVLEDQPGQHVAQLSGTFQGNLSDQFSAITAADISPDGSRIALLSRGAIYVFTQPLGDDFLNGTVHYNFFTFISNLEGVSFKNNCEVLISEEAQGGNNARLWSLNTCDIVTHLMESDEQLFSWQLIEGILQITPAQDSHSIELIELFDMSGRRVLSSKDSPMFIPPHVNGPLFARVSIGRDVYSFKILYLK